jgi:hypothetical protein
MEVGEWMATSREDKGVEIEVNVALVAKSEAKVEEMGVAVESWSAGVLVGGWMDGMMERCPRRP